MISQTAQKELNKLLEGNKNFIEGKPTAKNMCLKTLQSLALYQEPYACVLSCSDSRVVPEIIFDCGIGELFVVRVAGIAVGPNVKESIEYAVKKLHVPLLILLGHDVYMTKNQCTRRFEKVNIRSVCEMDTTKTAYCRPTL